MNWLSDFTPPGIKKIFRQREGDGDQLWSRCPACGEMIFKKDLEAAQHVCPHCDHHMRIGPKERLDALFDNGTWVKQDTPDVHDDPLKFKDTKKYADRLKEYRRKTGEKDAMVIGKGQIDGLGVVAAVQNFAFMGGSMGMALGEGIVRAAEIAIADRSPLVVFAASGGARMQEGILSLMQMPRTTIAVQMLRDEGLPYIVVLTDPTTGGVTASYAMLGDVHLAEPGALIGFAGPRVIEQTIREKLPDGFQRAEYLLDKGMVDQVVHRHEMRMTLSNLLRVLMKFEGSAASTIVLPDHSDEESDDVLEAEVVVSEELPKAAE
ncbi:acetyl-CoA carboxylase, carboxyltransferase subunit beta [Parvularcula sp. LCG005]|uniref:acetyl-CoA carboxylase, carboxyltransferase subunit beta n=1 Tax=Parvularcula sp. LCG005 TaxID=3078805 RepID=UPI002941BBAD|nr:acetyl-CoA carboxylase, carboxyltransferase subunit beta [Parvularcula sp. LCG005]WOI53260.1 acetyl-CoA carboxylase, carboxyltransferase subunit beta [Parvularcula sp. LCG005]